MLTETKKYVYIRSGTSGSFTEFAQSGDQTGLSCFPLTRFSYVCVWTEKLNSYKFYSLNNYTL